MIKSRSCSALVLKIVLSKKDFFGHILKVLSFVYLHELILRRFLVYFLSARACEMLVYLQYKKYGLVFIWLTVTAHKIREMCKVSGDKSHRNENYPGEKKNGNIHVKGWSIETKYKNYCRFHTILRKLRCNCCSKRWYYITPVFPRVISLILSYFPGSPDQVSKTKLI